jgi:hypothetical protein
MARIILPLAAIAAIVPFASAGISFTKPAAGTTLTANTAIEVAWEESSDGPKIADLITYELFLCAGGDASGEYVSAHLVYCDCSCCSNNTQLPAASAC